jgi:small subunit ribosomal protein S29
MLRRSVRVFCSDLSPSKLNERPRALSFDLPRSMDSTRLSSNERLRTTNDDRSNSMKIEESSPIGKIDEFFPTSLLSPQPEDLPAIDAVKVPHLWIRDDDILCSSAVSRFQRYSREELMNLLPEGLAGELPRDIFLMPSRTRDIGIMYRKITNEVINQLTLLESQKSMNKSGWLLEGKRGVGKSSVLNSVVSWARKQGNWIVLFEPFGSRFGKEIANIKRSSCGVYLQNELSRQLLERFIVSNRGLLEEVPINQAFYGRLGIDSSQVETIERVYLPLIEKAVAEKKDLTLSERVREVNRLRRSLTVPSLESKLTQPSSLLELCEFGINNLPYATQAAGELMNQLKVQDNFPVLVAVDEFNELFVVSEYVSSRYDNTIFNGYIPSYHLSLARMLCRWDGHEFKRGVKLYATTWARRNRRQFNPSILGIKEEEIKQVRNFTKNEFRNYLAYQHLTGTSHRFPQAKLDYFYMLTQGNGFQSRRVLATLH